MEPEDIKDVRSLEDWLRARPKDVAQGEASILAARAALRALPIWSGAMRERWAGNAGLTALTVLRLHLAAGVARKFPSNDMREAAASADARAFEAGAAADISAPNYSPMDSAEEKRNAHITSGAATSALHAARAALVGDIGAAVAAADRAILVHFDVSFYFWRNVQFDARLVAHGLDIEARPLWPDTAPEGVVDRDQTVRANWSRNPQTWSFWLRWWEGVLSGNHLDWELQREVALIPDAIWQQGPEAVARAIRDIEIDLAIRKTSNAEEIEPNPETGLLRLVPTSGLPEDIAAYTRRKIARTLALFGDPASAQLYGGLAADLRMLRQVAEDASNLPLELYDACASAGRRLAIRSANGECPPVEKDALLADYRARLGEIAADILSHDPMAQDVFERRNAITGNNALIEGAKIIEQAVMLIVPITEGHLTQALPRDAQLATDPESDPEDRKAASARLGGRFLRAAKWIGTAIARTVKIVDGTRKMLEAIPAIWDSPIFQHALGLLLKWLRL